ncbi:uncharacterized protein [Euphorbia lathyris]|uniref:uncharacterized protein n=1 Tax=Euphorbia lathyris TaxID=212925 RepID=UPI003313E41A
MNNLPPESAPPPPQQQLPLSELILSLEQAAFMAKQLPATANPTQIHQIYSSLHQAHKNLSSFISQTQISSYLPPPPPLHAAGTSQSHSSAGGGPAEQDLDEPMEIGEDDNEGGGGGEGEGNSKVIIEKVEEKFRGCFIKNKRVKRRLSPSLVAEERRLIEDGYDLGRQGYDPHEARIRALDLIFQFHC